MKQHSTTATHERLLLTGAQTARALCARVALSGAGPGRHRLREWPRGRTGKLIALALESGTSATIDTNSTWVNYSSLRHGTG